MAATSGGNERSVAAIAFAFADAGVDAARLDAVIVGEIGRAVAARCRFADARDTSSSHRRVLPMSGTDRSLVVARDAHEPPFSDDDIALAFALADHAAIALIHADKLRAAHAEVVHAREAMRVGLARFARLGQAGMLGVAVGTLDGAVTDINDTFAALLGYSRDEILSPGFDWFAMTPDEFRVSDARASVELRASGTAPLREKQYVRKDGSRVWVMVGAAMLDADSAITFVIDIHERKTHELDQRLRLAAIVESSADAILGMDLDGLITSWNRGAVELFGYTADEVIGKPVTMLLPPGCHPEEAPPLAKLRAGEVTRFETVRRHKLGHDLEVSMTISPIYDSSHRLIGGSKVAHDISARRAAERELSAAKDAAEMANHELESFSYSVAHDLRAPLRGIDGFSAFLLEDYADKLDDEGRGHLHDIRASTRRMSELIDALLSLSRVTRVELHREPTDLAELAREAVAQLARAEPSREVELAIAAPLVAEVDTRLARAAIDNLVGNAWKFTAAAEHPRIEMGRSRGAFYVRDNGAGFDMAHASKLFAPFQRMHSARQFPGTGVGLATVHRIVRRHGGRIWAEAAVGAGATFFFTLCPEPPA